MLVTTKNNKTIFKKHLFEEYLFFNLAIFLLKIMEEVGLTTSTAASQQGVIETLVLLVGISHVTFKYSHWCCISHHN